MIQHDSIGAVERRFLSEVHIGDYVEIQYDPAVMGRTEHNVSDNTPDIKGHIYTISVNGVDVFRTERALNLNELLSEMREDITKSGGKKLTHLILRSIIDYTIEKHFSPEEETGEVADESSET